VTEVLNTHARCRLATAELLKRHGVQPTKQSAAELEAAQGGGSADEADGSESGSGPGSREEPGEDEPGSDVEADELPADLAEKDGAAGSGGSGQEAESNGDVSGGEGEGRIAMQPGDMRDEAGSRWPPATDAAQRSKVRLPNN
jgi:hypothetical protein